MAQPSNFLDRQHSSFVESPTRQNSSAVETIDSSNRFAPPPNCDYIQRSVSGSTETFNFYSGGISGTLLKTVTLTYQSNALKELVSVEVVGGL